MKFFCLALVLTFSLFGGTVQAVELQGLEKTAQTANIDSLPADPAEVVNTVVSQVLGLIGILFLILMIYGGFLWMTAGGNEQQIKKAQKVVTGGLIGLVIVLSAYAITTYIGESFGANSPTLTTQ